MFASPNDRRTAFFSNFRDRRFNDRTLDPTCLVAESRFDALLELSGRLVGKYVTNAEVNMYARIDNEAVEGIDQWLDAPPKVPALIVVKNPLYLTSHIPGSEHIFGATNGLVIPQEMLHHADLFIAKPTTSGWEVTRPVRPNNQEGLKKKVGEWFGNIGFRRSG